MTVCNCGWNIKTQERYCIIGNIQSSHLVGNEASFVCSVNRAIIQGIDFIICLEAPVATPAILSEFRGRIGLLRASAGLPTGSALATDAYARKHEIFSSKARLTVKYQRRAVQAVLEATFVSIPGFERIILPGNADRGARKAGPHGI